MNAIYWQYILDGTYRTSSYFAVINLKEINLSRKIRKEVICELACLVSDLNL